MIFFPPWKIAVIWLACVASIVFALPTFVPPSYTSWAPSWLNKRMPLGLDLRGGSHLLLEVDMSAVMSERLNNLVDASRAALRRNQITTYRSIGVAGDAVVIRPSEPGQGDRIRQALRDLDTDARVTVADDGSVRVAFSEQALNERRKHIIEQSIEIVRRRVDELGTTEPDILRQGEDRILVQLPGVDDPERVKQIIGRTARLTFHLLDLETPLSEAMAGRVPAASMLVPSVEERGGGQGQPYLLRKRVILSGEMLVDARGTFQENQAVVSFRFDAAGARRFADITRENVGKPFAIVLDGKVISAPVIREPILGGSGIISGNFTVQSANDLALLLRAGALPAPLTVLEERSVGPGLGTDSVEAGKLAAVVAMVLVVGGMVVAYGLFGIFANIALIFNIAMIFSSLSILQATLTLPGIAGIALTMGMAVDANVLIFERIREEIDNGRSPLSAIEAGYTRAMATIIDSNLTTLIATVLLFQFGTGPVRGFAVTLSLGIVTSMFTAIVVTRYLTYVWLRRTKPQTIPI